MERFGAEEVAIAEVIVEVEVGALALALELNLVGARDWEASGPRVPLNI